MKIALYSDLHLSVHPLELPPTSADVVVLAGDLQRPATGMAWGAAVCPTHAVCGGQPRVLRL